jgi:thiosulfate/3-mercaptopyruvate sulfurtransferase
MEMKNQGNPLLEEIQTRGYAYPEYLVTTTWVSENLGKPGIRIIESNEDSLLYASGHIPGAVEIDWTRDLNNSLIRDYLDGKEFRRLMSRSGIARDTTVVFYGDKNNWWAAYAFWIFQLFGHRDARIMDGGRLKWQKENRTITRDASEYPAADYPVVRREDSRIRAFREQVLRHVQVSRPLVDVRSPEEFRGERLHMEGYPNEGALRGGHIPGAIGVPWARAVDPETGAFKSADELRAIYIGENRLKPDEDVIVYCRIGERSSHTWFVLTFLLGFDKVRNYDGSWTEWGNLVNVPIER